MKDATVMGLTLFHHAGQKLLNESEVLEIVGG
jgi:hypothetical protein